jgi:hypothetical protein
LEGLEVMDIPKRMAEINEQLALLYKEAAELQELYMLGFQDSEQTVPDNVTVGPWGTRDVHNPSE